MQLDSLLQRLMRLSLWEAISSPANFPNYDTRTGLGYGTQSGYHAQRSYQGSFPYRDHDPYADDVEEEDEVDSDLTTKARNKTASSITPSDPYAARSTDPFYFVGAATPLSAFMEAVVQNSSKGSIVAKPGMYKRKIAVVGGYVGSPVSPVKDINNHKSTPHGYSKASLPIEDYIEPIEDKTLQNLRSVIRAYHSANLLRK